MEKEMKARKIGLGFGCLDRKKMTKDYLCKRNQTFLIPKHWGQKPISPSLNQRNGNLVYPLFLPPSPITFSPLFTLPKKAINEFTNLLFKLNFQKYNLKQEFSSFQETRYKIQIKKSGDYKNK